MYLGVAVFIRNRLGSFGRAKKSPRSLGFVCFHSGALSGRLVHSGSRGFTQSAKWYPGSFSFACVSIGVAGFIQVGLGSLSTPSVCQVHS